MKTADFPAVKRAKRIAIAQLDYYLRMMKPLEAILPKPRPYPLSSAKRRRLDRFPAWQKGSPQ